MWELGIFCNYLGVKNYFKTNFRKIIFKVFVNYLILLINLNTSLCWITFMNIFLFPLKYIVDRAEFRT